MSRKIPKTAWVGWPAGPSSQRDRVKNLKNQRKRIQDVECRACGHRAVFRSRWNFDDAASIQGRDTSGQPASRQRMQRPDELWGPEGACGIKWIRAATACLTGILTVLTMVSIK